MSIVALDFRKRRKIAHHPSQWDEVSKPIFSTTARVRVKTNLSLIHISEPTRLGMISYAVFCLKKKEKKGGQKKAGERWRWGARALNGPKTRDKRKEKKHKLGQGRREVYLLSLYCCTSVE